MSLRHLHGPFFFAGLLVWATVSLTVFGCAQSPAPQTTTNPYADYVWPPAPDEPRIGLVDVIMNRADLEGEGKLSRALIATSPKTRFDQFLKPFGVGIDDQGRILVADTGLGALVRVDLSQRRWDVFGTQGAGRLGQPIGLGMGPDGTIYVADVALRQVVAFSGDGDFRGTYGDPGELDNPTDAAVSPDGKKLYVADSKKHQIFVFDLATRQLEAALGEKGVEPGQFYGPTSLAFNPDGELFVVDQLNARVQVLEADGEYIDEFGGRGIGFGKFVRPKDVAIDQYGLIYVTDAAFNNVQIFDIDFALLTFVGRGGGAPGEFNNMTGVAVDGDRFVLVDQNNRRIQVAEYLFDRGQG